MSNNGDNSKKSANSFALLSQKMNEVQKSKKPEKNQTSKQNSYRNLNRSNSSATIDLDDDNMSPPRSNMSPPQSGDRDPNVPDRSFGDYFCPLCDSHMNSDGMWVAHISGKRHLKNVDKGSNDPKYDDLDVESCIKQEIKNVKDPVIGLSYIHEIRRKDKGAPPIFTCFLCQATFPTVPLIIEHILTMKHRMNFMKENSPDDYQLLEATNLKKGHMEPLVEEMALKLEQKFGKGAVKVKQEKHKIPPAYTYSSKRSLGTDDEEEKNPRKNLKSDDKDSYSWKREQRLNKEIEKDKYGRDVDRRRRHASSEDEDKYKRHNSPPRSQPSKKLDYYDNPKRHESSFPRDSYKKDSFYSKKTVSPMRSFHPRSSPPRDIRKENYKIPYGPEPPPFHSSSSLQYREETPVSSHNKHPSSAETEDSRSHFVDFVKKIMALPTEVVLRLALNKLEDFNAESFQEISLILCLIQKGDEVVNKSIPPALKELMKQKLSQSENVPSNSPQSMHQIPSSSTLPNRSQSQGDLNFINAYRAQQKSQSVISSVAPPVGDVVGVPPHKTPSYAGQTFGSSSQTLGSSNQAYGSSNQAYGSSNQAYGSSNLIYKSSNQIYGNQIQIPTTQGNVNSSSLQNYASSRQNNSYSNAISPNSSGIPGLTLAEENRERENYSFGILPNQSSHYPSYGY